MRLARTRFTRRDKASALRGFTLVEVLAALVFMAILIPVTVRAVRVASQAGHVGERKAVAARVAERVMNELLVTDGLRQNSANGRIEERHRTYDWMMRSEPWTEDAMSLVTVRVTYQVQGREYDVNLSTLFDSAETTATEMP
jgi:prepilin-type N-terminal cleavage/methylation domain-containing protein